MGANRPLGLPGVSQGHAPSRRRLSGPLRYLAIRHPQKDVYDFVVPVTAGLALWAGFCLIEPKIHLFGETGLIKFFRDFLIMAIPFMIGALAAAAMGAPSGTGFDKRLKGAELVLDGRVLTVRQFLCLLLGYLCFIGLFALILLAFADAMRPVLLVWLEDRPFAKSILLYAGSLAFFQIASTLFVTLFWSLYFLSDIVNRPE